MVSFQCVPACVVCAHFQCVCVYSRRCLRPLCTLEPWLNDKIMWMKNITKHGKLSMCSCLRCLCPLSMCLRLLSSVFVPTLHSITLFLPLSLYFETIRIFVNFVYARVCVQSLCLCNLYFYQTVPFCPLCAFLALCVCLPSFLFAHGVCVRSDLFVSTLLVLFVPTLGVCVYSRRCLRPLCFCPLCVLLVFLSILFHTKTYEPFISGMCWHVDAYSSSRILQNNQLNHISAM